MSATAFTAASLTRSNDTAITDREDDRPSFHDYPCPGCGAVVVPAEHGYRLVYPCCEYAMTFGELIERMRANGDLQTTEPIEA